MRGTLKIARCTVPTAGRTNSRGGGLKAVGYGVPTHNVHIIIMIVVHGVLNGSIIIITSSLITSRCSSSVR